jgi:hypothetical protein
MKAVSASILFAGLAAAHSAVWNITFDGNVYVPGVMSDIKSQSDPPTAILPVMGDSMMSSMLSALSGTAPRCRRAILGHQSTM